jgi:hypothetical protein
MRKGPEKTPFLRAALLLLLVLLIPGWLSGCGRTTAAEPGETIPDHGHGLFSWHDEVFGEEDREILLQLMREQGLTELYQDVPHTTPTSQVRELAEACSALGIRLYLLVGEPEWALDRKATELRSEIQRAALIGCAGIMVDIEPGSTDKWKKDRDSVMSSMTEAFLAGKAAAEREGLEMIACLSWYYDDYGYEAELERLISEGCDTLAIMNYHREDEIGQIETEAGLCRNFGKPLISIYELQEIGKYDLEEIHTYREAGLPALWESWEELRNAFPDQEISAALHEYRALKAMCLPTI